MMSRLAPWIIRPRGAAHIVVSNADFIVCNAYLATRIASVCYLCDARQDDLHGAIVLFRWPAQAPQLLRLTELYHNAFLSTHAMVLGVGCAVVSSHVE